MDDLHDSTSDISSSLSTSLSSSSEKLSWTDLLRQNTEIIYSDNLIYENNIKILDELKHKIIIFETQDEYDTLGKSNYFVRPYIIFLSTIEQYIILNNDPELSKLGMIYIKLSDQYINCNKNTLDVLSYTSDNYPKINIIKKIDDNNNHIIVCYIELNEISKLIYQIIDKILDDDEYDNLAIVMIHATNYIYLKNFYFTNVLDRINRLL
jgi:hypothetical protein